MLGCFVQESFDLVIVGFAGYAVLLIVLCFGDYLYIRITGTGVWFIRRSVFVPMLPLGGRFILIWVY